MQIRTKAHIAVAFANVFYSINFIVMKNVTTTIMKPIALNLIRVTGATILFWVLWLTQPNKIKIAKKDYFQFFICAVSGIVINQIFFVKGVSLTTTIRASLLMLLTPISVVFIAAILLKEKITKQKLVGLLLGVFGGVVLITLRENTKPGENLMLGDSLIVINAISYSFYLVWVKPLMKTYEPLFVIAILFTIGFFIMLPLGFGQVVAIHWHTISSTNYWAIAFIVLAVTFCTYLFNLYGIKVLGPSITGAYIYAQPLFVAVLSIFMQSDLEKIGLKLLAAFLIFCGVYLVASKKEILQSNNNN